jgi:hypothetical protein
MAGSTEVHRIHRIESRRIEDKATALIDSRFRYGGMIGTRSMTGFARDASNRGVRVKVIFHR